MAAKGGGTAPTLRSAAEVDKPPYPGRILASCVRDHASSPRQPGTSRMQGKIALEEHFAVEATLGDSQVFGAHVWQELGPRLTDFQDKRLRLMDASGVEIMIASLNAPAVQAHGRRARRAVLPAPAQSAAGRNRSLRGPQLAARPELGVSRRDRRARAAADRLGAVRRISETADHPRSSRRGHSGLSLAH